MAQPRNVGHREDLTNLTHPKPKQGCGSSNAGVAKTRQNQEQEMWRRANEVLSGDLEHPDALAATAPELRGTATPHPLGRHPILDVIAEPEGLVRPHTPQLWDKDWYRPDHVRPRA